MPAQPPPTRPRWSPLGGLSRSWTAVLAGGVIGSAARIGITYHLPAEPHDLPVATLIVNLAGSLLLGFYLARRERTVTARWSLPFWGIGVFGSFTTFSAFSIEVVRLIEHGETMTAGIHVAASVVGGVILALVGQGLGSVVR